MPFLFYGTRRVPTTLELTNLFLAIPNRYFYHNLAKVAKKRGLARDLGHFIPLVVEFIPDNTVYIDIAKL